MKRIFLNGANQKGLQFQINNDFFQQVQWFGLPCAPDCSFLECSGTFFLHTDLGRFEANRFRLQDVSLEKNTLYVTQKTINGEYLLKTVYSADEATGIISRKDYLTNCISTQSVIYACLPRIVLQGDQYEFYGQASGWCKENQGQWIPMEMGTHLVTNSAGRSTDTATPFACIRQKGTGIAAAIHVLPVGDWIIQAHRIAEGGTRRSYTVLEAGLSDRNLHMAIEPGETLELPELIFLGFTGNVEACSEPLQRYLLERYGVTRLSDPVYNTWFLDFDVIEPDRLRQQVLAAKNLGCRIFVVDAGWFGKGLDWSSQVGCWEECKEQAFCGNMKEFSEYVRANGMGFGLWMEPERACKDTEVYQKHPEWFLDEDTIIYDMGNPQVQEYLCDQLTNLVETYKLSWMKLDFNSNFFRDRTGSNFYRYFRAEQKFMQMIRKRNPNCFFEGCSGGGLRSDFHNSLTYYNGHFVTDTVHPIESMRIRQGIALRMLPGYAGAWMVLHEVSFGIGSYSNHNRNTRTKVFSCGDAWWEHTVDVSADFATKLNLLGQLGLSGDLTSFSEETIRIVQRAISFYTSHQDFMGRSICHLLTAVQKLNDITGWTAMQYENVDGKGSVLFVFRLVDDAEDLLVFPKNLSMEQMYRVVCDGTEVGIMTGAEIAAQGLEVTCATRYSGKILELLPQG